MELRPYQNEAKEKVLEQWNQGVRKTLLVLPTGCHEENQEILMSDGSLKKIKDINIGEQVMGADGLPRNILFKQKGTKLLYKVQPVKGESFLVTEDHKLTLVRTNEKSRNIYPSDKLGGQIIDVSIKEWLSWSKNKKHIHKLIRSGLIKNFGFNNGHIISPYFLGILLGDGNLVNSISVTTMDDEVVSEIKNQCLRYDMTYSIEPSGKANTYIFKSGELGCKGSLLHRQLKELGLRGKGSYEKFIPHNYKASNYINRLEILAGLIDTDGSATNGGYDFVSASKQLSNDVAFIARSLGLAAYVKKCKKRCKDFEGIYYRVGISGDCSIIPCRVSHKKVNKRRQIKDVKRTGFTVLEYGIGNYVGITVDVDNRYLMGDFTITHNCGKTIVFSKVIEDVVKSGDRVLMLAHRGELLDQAADKLDKATGLKCAVEKAEDSCLGSFYRVVVGSVQSLMRPKRLNKFDKDYFDTIVIDEAHHCISDGYQRVLEHFDSAKVLGVTATPDRGDMKNLGSYFESLAYEYTLPKAIKEGFLSQIKALTIPLKLDLSGVSQQAGDFKASEIGTALDPYLEQIADEMVKYCSDRKTVVFLPLIKTSQKFTRILQEKGFRAAEVNGDSENRGQILEDFDNDRYNVLCNSMLLTEGWDCPSVDCIIVLRPTKVRSLYSQMVGRGTRLHPGKEDLLVLDFLWHTERHELCHPASLIAPNEEVSKAMTKIIEESGNPQDLEEVEKMAEEEVILQREEALAKQLEEMRKRKRKLVDPLQFEMSINAEDLVNYVPAFGWEMGPASEKQIKTLEKLGIFPDQVDNAGKAKMLLDRLDSRRKEGLTTPKQIRFLEQRGFKNVGMWEFDSARKLIDRIAGNGWKIPKDIDVKGYKG
ncbi:DEAD/DEAH box helicase family protein [Peptostreptococcus equinus]|uniref:DEAD/DEAH box helicase family protein n=1 Tax=Peptostreptococcus equinus TaxID=3003601 RepID=UPI002F2B6275